MDELTTKKIMEMRAVQARIEDGQRKLESLQTFSTELTVALNTVNNLADTKAGESLFPIGSGVFVRASVSDAKVLVEIGAGVVAEKTPEEASAILKQRFNEVINAANQIQAQLNELMDRNDKLVDELQKSGVN